MKQTTVFVLVLVLFLLQTTYGVPVPLSNVNPKQRRFTAIRAQREKFTFINTSNCTRRGQKCKLQKHKPSYSEKRLNRTNTSNCQRKGLKCTSNSTTYSRKPRTFCRKHRRFFLCRKNGRFIFKGFFWATPFNVEISLRMNSVVVYHPFIQRVCSHISCG